MEISVLGNRNKPSRPHTKACLGRRSTDRRHCCMTEQHIGLTLEHSLRIGDVAHIALALEVVEPRINEGLNVILDPPSIREKIVDAVLKPFAEVKIFVNEPCAPPQLGAEPNRHLELELEHFGRVGVLIQPVNCVL